MSAREEVLGRIRAALHDAPPVPEVPRTYRGAGLEPPGSPRLLDLFAERVDDYRATVRRCREDDVAAAVAEELARQDVDPAHLLRAPGVPRAWLPDAEPDDGRDATALDAVPGVLTGCALAVAETGTFVLDGSDVTGRRALTLVPDLHVCVVRAAQVVASVPDAVAALDPTRPLTFVSGPSATSDIELERVEGVHGPRRLVVVLVDG